MTKTNLWETLKIKYFTKFMLELYSEVSWMAKIWVHLHRHSVITQNATIWTINAVMTWKVMPQHPKLFSQYSCITPGSVNLCPTPVALWKNTATLQADNCLGFYIGYYRYSSFKTPFNAAAIKFTHTSFQFKKLT
jgi:hypothetical protein